MSRIIFPIWLILSVLLTPTISVSADLIETANRIGYISSTGEVTYFVGVDFRLEIFELFQNWLGEEDPTRITPIQMYPLRQAMLEELAPFRDHQAVVALGEFIEKYNYETKKMLLNAGELPYLNSHDDWLKYIRRPYQLQGHDPQEFNRDISSWMDEVNLFISESNIMIFLKDIKMSTAPWQMSFSLPRSMVKC